jgi:hypothetical protein
MTAMLKLASLAVRWALCHVTERAQSTPGARTRADQTQLQRKWTLVPDPAMPAGRGGPVGRGFEFVAAHDEKTLTVTMTKMRPDSEGPGPKWVYALDGSQTTNDNGFASKVKWDGNKLVISTTPPPAGTVETWSLSGPINFPPDLINSAPANPNKVQRNDERSTRRGSCGMAREVQMRDLW